MDILFRILDGVSHSWMKLGLLLGVTILKYIAFSLKRIGLVQMVEDIFQADQSEGMVLKNNDVLPLSWMNRAFIPPETTHVLGLILEQRQQQLRY